MGKRRRGGGGGGGGEEGKGKVALYEVVSM